MTEIKKYDIFIIGKSDVSTFTYNLYKKYNDTLIAPLKCWFSCNYDLGELFTNN